MPLRQVTVRTVILAPHHRGLVGRVPVLFPDSLEERREPDIVPVKTEVEAVHEPRRLVSDDLAVAGVTDTVLAAVNVAVAVQVLVLGVTETGLVVLRGPDEGVEIGLSGSLGASLGGVDRRLVLPETVRDEAPQLADPHALVVVAGKGLVGVVIQVLQLVVVLVDDRVVVGQGGPDVVIERLAAEVEGVLPAEGHLEAIGREVGVVALRRCGSEHIRDGRTGNDHVGRTADIVVSRTGETTVQEAEVDTAVVSRSGLPGKVLGQGRG